MSTVVAVLQVRCRAACDAADEDQPRAARAVHDRDAHPAHAVAGACTPMFACRRGIPALHGIGLSPCAFDSTTRQLLVSDGMQVAFGDMALSVINELPPGRLPISTRVLLDGPEHRAEVGASPFHRHRVCVQVANLRLLRPLVA